MMPVMMHRVPLLVRLETFEGPLDLLLHLIQSNEMSITKISLAEITDQYLLYVRMIQELNFDIASEFLLMAATLIQWKSKALLPQEEKAGGADGDDDAPLTQEDLIRQLLELQRFRKAAEIMGGQPLLGQDVFVRPAMRPPVEKVWRDMSVTSLALSFQDLLTRQRRRTTVLKKETVSISEKVADFADRLVIGKPMDLRNLMSENPVKGEIVVTFLASLELARLKKLKVYQEGVYEAIFIEAIDDLRDIQPGLISGFDQAMVHPAFATATTA